MKDHLKKDINTDEEEIEDITEDVEFEELDNEGDELDNNGKVKKLREKIKKLEEEKIFESKIVTKVLEATKFYKAEDYHQDYFKNNPTNPYCQVIISPKLEKLKNI